MMRCETCCQEYTAFDFVTLRNLCEHLYLDSLAQKRNHSFPRPAKPFHGLNISQPVRPREVEPSESLGELVLLEQ
jgi:hypothetical protein